MQKGPAKKQAKTEEGERRGVCAGGREESEEEQRETTHRPRSGECVEEKRESVRCLFGSKEVEWCWLEGVDSHHRIVTHIPVCHSFETALGDLFESTRFYQVEGWDGDDG